MPELSDLLTSWLRRLRGEQKSPHTLEGYAAAVRTFLRFCDEQQLPAELGRDNVVAYMASRTGRSRPPRCT